MFEFTVDEDGKVTPPGAAERYAVPITPPDNVEGRDIGEPTAGTPIYKGRCGHLVEVPDGKKDTHRCEAEVLD